MTAGARNFYSEIRRRYPVLDRRTFNELHAKYKAGDMTARDVLVGSNMGLVLGIAWRFTNHGVSFDDLVQAGQKALLRSALPKYEPARGLRFSTYAGYWIRHGCAEEIARTSTRRPYHVPTHALDFRRTLQIMSTRLSHKLGRAATEDEVRAEYEKRRNDGGQRGTRQDKSDSLMSWALNPEQVLSLDVSPKAGTNISLHELLQGSGDTSCSPEALASLREEHGIVQRALERVGSRERAVLIARFGLGVAPRTLREIGVEYGLTRERIRQLEEQGLRQLAHVLKISKGEIAESLEGLAQSWSDREERRLDPPISMDIDESNLLKVFTTLCEHAVDRLGDGHIRVKSPERTLYARSGLTRDDAQGFLRAMQSKGWLRWDVHLDEAEVLRRDRIKWLAGEKHVNLKL